MFSHRFRSLAAVLVGLSIAIGLLAGSGLVNITYRYLFSPSLTITPVGTLLSPVSVITPVGTLLSPVSVITPVGTLLMSTLVLTNPEGYLLSRVQDISDPFKYCLDVPIRVYEVRNVTAFLTTYTTTLSTITTISLYAPCLSLFGMTTTGTTTTTTTGTTTTTTGTTTTTTTGTTTTTAGTTTTTTASPTTATTTGTTVTVPPTGTTRTTQATTTVGGPPILGGIPSSLCMLTDEWWLIPLAILLAVSLGVLSMFTEIGSIALMFSGGAVTYMLTHATVSKCGLEPSLILGLVLYSGVFLLASRLVSWVYIREEDLILEV